MSVEVKGAVFMATPQTAHLSDFFGLEMSLQAFPHALLRARSHARSAIAHVRLLALVFGLQEVVKGNTAVHIGLPDQKIIGQLLHIIGGNSTLTGGGNPQFFKQIFGETLPARQEAYIFRHVATAFG